MSHYTVRELVKETLNQMEERIHDIIQGGLMSKAFQVCAQCGASGWTKTHLRDCPLKSRDEQ